MEILIDPGTRIFLYADNEAAGREALRFHFLAPLAWRHVGISAVRLVHQSDGADLVFGQQASLATSPMVMKEFW